jgi:hypothetical protein
MYAYITVLCTNLPQIPRLLFCFKIYEHFYNLCPVLHVTAHLYSSRTIGEYRFLENSVLWQCRHSNSLAQFSQIMSLSGFGVLQGTKWAVDISHICNRPVRVMRRPLC